jgi:hypothetical protein
MPQNPSSDADVLKRLREWHKASASEMRLRCGEMTAGEIRSIRAVLNAIMGDSTQPDGESR